MGGEGDGARDDGSGVSVTARLTMVMWCWVDEAEEESSKASKTKAFGQPRGKWVEPSNQSALRPVG